MADLTHDQGARKWAVDKAWLASATLVLLVALFDWPQVAPMLAFAARAFAGTLPFIAFAVLAVAFLKASGAEALLAHREVPSHSLCAFFRRLVSTRRFIDSMTHRLIDSSSGA